MATPQARQACPSPRHRLQNVSSQTGPASAALSQGQGLSPQKGSGHPSLQLGEQSPGKGGALRQRTQETGSDQHLPTRLGSWARAASRAQNPHPPGHTLGLHVASGQSQMWRKVGPGTETAPRGGKGVTHNCRRPGKEREGKATGSGARAWATWRQERPAPDPLSGGWSYPEGHRPAPRGHSPAQPPFTRRA